MDNGWDDSDFESSKFDEMVNFVLEKQKEDRIMDLKQKATNAIRVKHCL